MIDNAVGRGEKEIDHSGQDNRGYEMRHIDGGLGKALEPFAVQLVQHDRQEDRNRETEQQAVEVQQEGVRKHPPAVIAVEEFFEIFQSDPLAAGNAEGGFIVPEGNLYAVHREITEYNEKCQAGQQQHPQLPVTAQG